MTSPWLAFWNSSHSIYVNARHKDVHYRQIAEQIAALVPSRQARMLDYGSGEALHADLIAASTGELLLCDAAPRVRAAIAARFKQNKADQNTAKIRVIAPEEVERLPEHSLDFIVVHSVVQYLTAAEAGTLFALFHRLLKLGGVLLVSDVIPPHTPATTEAAELLRFAAGNGFLTAALFGLARTLMSNYVRLRTRIGLNCYAEPTMLAELAAAGFTAQRLPKNIGHSRARMAFIARSR